MAALEKNLENTIKLYSGARGIFQAILSESAPKNPEKIRRGLKRVEGIKNFLKILFPLFNQRLDNILFGKLYNIYNRFTNLSHK